MGLTTNGLPTTAAFGNTTVVVVTTPDGGLVWTSWELGSNGPPWASVPINGPARHTNVAPAVSFRKTLGSRPQVWLTIRDSSDGQIYTTLQTDGGFQDWTLIPGKMTQVSPAVQYPLMIVVAAPPDDALYINVDLTDQPSNPPPSGYWKPITPSLFTAMAPAFTFLDAPYMFIAVAAINFEGPNSRIMLNQGNPYTPDQLVRWSYTNMDSNLAPAMAAANNRTVIVAVDPNGAIFYDWWDLGGGPHGWVQLAGGYDIRTKVAPAVALVDNGNYMFVFAQGLDGELYLNQANVGGSIIGWERSEP